MGAGEVLEDLEVLGDVANLEDFEVSGDLESWGIWRLSTIWRSWWIFATIPIFRGTRAGMPCSGRRERASSLLKSPLRQCVAVCIYRA